MKKDTSLSGANQARSPKTARAEDYTLKFPFYPAPTVVLAGLATSSS